MSSKSIVKSNISKYKEKANTMSITKEIGRLKEEVMGHYSEISDIAGVTKQAVGQVLNGEYQNEKVVEAAIQVRDTLRKKRALLLKKLTK